MATTGIAVKAHRTQVLLLRALYFGPRSFWQLLRAGKAQANQVLQALQSLLDNQLAAYDGSRFVITPAGRQKVEALGLDRVADPQCETCGGARTRPAAALRPCAGGVPGDRGHAAEGHHGLRPGLRHP